MNFCVWLRLWLPLLYLLRIRRNVKRKRKYEVFYNYRIDKERNSEEKWD